MERQDPSSAGRLERRSLQNQPPFARERWQAFRSSHLRRLGAPSERRECCREDPRRGNAAHQARRVAAQGEACQGGRPEVDAQAAILEGHGYADLRDPRTSLELEAIDDHARRLPGPVLPLDRRRDSLVLRAFVGPAVPEGQQASVAQLQSVRPMGCWADVRYVLNLKHEFLVPGKEELMLEVEDVPNIRPAAHGTNALELSDGSLLALWYCGSYEGAEDQRIAASVKRQDGAWESPRVVVDRFEFEGGAWIPEIGVPVPLQDGSLSIYFWAPPLASFTLRGDPPRWVRSIPASRVFSTTLSPLGWGAEATQMTAPESLPALSGERGLVLQGSALKTTSGRWILPFHSENEQWWLHSRFLVSDDEGTSWQTRGDLHAGPGCLEPALAQLPSGEILCYLRRGAKMGHIWRAVSWDDGDTWSDPVPTNLRNPHSGVDIAVGAAGRLL